MAAMTIHITCVICACYRHPNGNVSHFIRGLEHVLQGLPKDCLSFVVGDINIDLLKYDTCPMYDSYLSLLLSHRFIPTITLPTRVTDDTMTLIDHIFVRLPNRLLTTEIKSGNIYCDISDHLPNFCILNKVVQPLSNERPLIRLYSQKNFDRYITLIGNTDFDDIVICNCVNTAYSALESILKLNHDICFPLVRQSRAKFKSKPWVNSAIRVSICHKNRLYRKYLAKPSIANKNSLSRYRKILVKTIHESQSKYYSEILNSRQTSPRKAWALINSLISDRNKRTKKSIKQILYEGKTNINDHEIANAFNDHFVTVGPKLANAITNGADPQRYFDRPNQSSIFLSPVTTNEVVTEIYKLKLHKSPGMDGINNRILKSVSQYISHILAYIFNLSFTTGEYPQTLKVAKVIPLFKKGDAKQPENYRPISLLSSINKLLEKSIEKRIRNYLLEKQILYEFQFGFRSGYSTTHALLEITNNIRKHLDSGENVLGLYLDLKKAFDTVDHVVLKKKMHNYGIRGKCHELLTSYLRDRSQVTFVNGVYSQPKIITTGVPQGSVLGPLLFLVYINDLKNVVNNFSVRLFADDTNIFLYHRNCQTLINNAKVALQCLKSWFDANKLTLHIGKTNFTIFHSSKRHHVCHDSFDIDGMVIKKTDATKYLGLTIDHELSWKCHINDLCRSIIKYVGIFSKIRDCIPLSLRHQLYYAFVHSRIAYGIEVYGVAKQTLIKPLQVMQNRIIKTLFGKCRRYPTNQLYKETELMMIKDIHRQKMYILLYKYANGKLPELFTNVFNPGLDRIRRSTRNNRLFTVSLVRKYHGQFLLNNYGNKLWQTLPQDVKNNQTLPTFKKSLKKQILSLYL